MCLKLILLALLCFSLICVFIKHITSLTAVTKPWQKFLFSLKQQYQKLVLMFRAGNKLKRLGSVHFLLDSLHCCLSSLVCKPARDRYPPLHCCPSLLPKHWIINEPKRGFKARLKETAEFCGTSQLLSYFLAVETGKPPRDLHFLWLILRSVRNQDMVYSWVPHEQTHPTFWNYSTKTETGLSRNVYKILDSPPHIMNRTKAAVMNKPVPVVTLFSVPQWEACVRSPQTQVHLHQSQQTNRQRDSEGHFERDVRRNRTSLFLPDPGVTTLAASVTVRCVHAVLMVLHCELLLLRYRLWFSLFLFCIFGIVQ